MGIGSSLRSDSGTNYTDQFRDCAKAISEFFNKLGVEVTPYRESQLPLFNALPSHKRQEACHYLELFSKTIEPARRNEVNFKNDAQALWEALKILKLRHTSDLFSHFRDDHKIEIYNPEGIQIWRNFNVLKICSYTLEEIYCLSWQERYHRDDSDTLMIGQTLQELFKPNSGTINAMIPYHTVTEKISLRGYVLKARHDQFSPLLDENHQMGGFVVTSMVEILSSNSKIKPPVFRDLSLT